MINPVEFRPSVLARRMGQYPSHSRVSKSVLVSQSCGTMTQTCAFHVAEVAGDATRHTLMERHLAEFRADLK